MYKAAKKWHLGKNVLSCVWHGRALSLYFNCCLTSFFCFFILMMKMK